MADNKLIARADEVYDILVSELDSREWHYDEDREKRTIRFSVSGKQMAVAYDFKIDADRQLILLNSLLPFDIKEGKSGDFMLAVCRTNYSLPDGRFRLYLENDAVSFDMTCSYIESLIGEELFEYLINYTLFIVDRYGPRLKDLNDDVIDVQKYIDTIGE